MQPPAADEPSHSSCDGLLDCFPTRGTLKGVAVPPTRSETSHLATKFNPTALDSPRMQNIHQSSQQSCSPGPPEFRPMLEGRLFTAHDATVDANCEVHPTARLLYDSLPLEYREVFKNCPMYLEKHMEFVKFLKTMSEIDVTKADVNHELLRPLGIQVPTEEGDKKKWQCGVIGCGFKDTLQHLYTHLQQKKHIDLAMFACHYCKRPFNRANDRNRHEVKMHGNASSPQTGSSRSTRGISHPNAVGQIPTGKTRTGKNLNRPEKRPPAYTDAVYNEDTSTSSDTPSSSEGDDPFFTRENPWSSSNFDVFHDTDANKRYLQDLACPFGSEGVPRLNQEPVEPFSAATGRSMVAIPAAEPTQSYGHVSVPQPNAGDRYNYTPAGNPRPQSQSQLFFTIPNQQNLGPASSSNGLMLQSTHDGNGSQGLAAPPVGPIQSTNNGGMHAQIINNNYHIHNATKPPQFAGNMDTRPLPVQWPTNMAYSPIYSQSHDYLQASALSQTPVYAAPAAYAPSGSYCFYGCRRGPTHDTMYDLNQGQFTAAYPNLSMGHGTMMKVWCTWMPRGPEPFARCLHEVENADAFKNRSLDNVSIQVQDHGKLPNESAMSPSGLQNALNYGEKQAQRYQLSIPDFMNSISSNASCILPQYSSDVVEEKGIINRRFTPAIFRVRRIMLLIMCCLVALLLSVGLFIHPGWQFWGFAL